ncbi:MAG TPA: hypothetical protein DCS87_16440 [Rheinheimera sp.]|nr:hypothetical protein [Rheinheimera sp.]
MGSHGIAKGIRRVSRLLCCFTLPVMAQTANPQWLNISPVQVADQSAPAVTPSGSTSMATFALPAEGGVDNGQASYQIPLQIAPGRAGMQPKLSLNYGSQGGNGVVGVGWSFNGGAGLSRCAPTFEQDEVRDKVTKVRAVTGNPSTDRLCLNGSRLMVVSGNYNESGAVYRTELDSLVRVTQQGFINDANVSFVAEFPDGRKVFFGNTADSRVKGDDSDALVLSWLVSKELDVTGNNAIDYVYGNSGHGEVLLQSIYYTGNGTARGEQQVQLSYEARPDIHFGYNLGSRYNTTKRLKAITVSSALASGSRSYVLDYQQSQHSGRSLLRSVRYCVGSDCSAPQQFNWSDAKGAIVTDALKFAGRAELAGAKWLWQIAPFGDLDGDGAIDFKAKHTNAEQGVLSDNLFDSNMNCYQRYHGMECPMIDADVDGLMDPINWKNGTLTIRLSSSANDFSTGLPFNGFFGSDGSANTADRIESTADFNGDGFPDLLLYNYVAPVSTWTLYTNTRDRSRPFSSSIKVVIRAEADRSLIGQTIRPGPLLDAGDLNGDGLPDLVAMMPAPGKLGATKAQLIQQLFFSNPTLPGLFSTKNPDLPGVVYAGDDYYVFQRLVDVNGDSASDVISLQMEQGTVRLGYQLNNGKGEFTPWRAFGGNFDLPLRQHSIEVVPGEAATVHSAKFSNMPVVDSNLDGRPELMLPSARVVTGCATVGFPGSPGIIKKLCGDELYDAVLYKVNQIPSFPIDSEYLDDSVYQFNAVSMVPQADGSYNLVERATAYYGSATQSSFIDAFGDGQLDLVTAYGPRAAGKINTSSIDQATAIWPVSSWGNAWGAYISRNYGSGDGATTADYQAVDLLIGASNGLGQQHQWQYKPLTTGISSAGQKRLYCVAESALGETTECADPKKRTTDGNNINFASSMYVVQSYKAPSGQKDPVETQYAYRGAMFNVGGRGFTGFQLLLEKDMQRGLLSQQRFLQKFPITGLLQSENVSLNSILLRHTTNEWSDNTAHAQSAVRSKFVYLNTLTRSRTDIFDTTGTALAIDEHWPENVDQYDNAKHQYVRHTDKVDGVDIVYKSVTTTTFAPDESKWWLDKASSVDTTTQLMQNTWQNILSDGAYPIPIYSLSKTVIVDSWNLARQPLTVLTKASNSNCKLNTTNQFNNFGLLTAVTSQSSGCGGTQSRTVTTSYTKNGTTPAADGYVPLQVTNSLGHASVTNFDMLTGQPTRTSMPNGVVQTVTYDNAGRPLSKSQTGMPTQFIRYVSPQSSSNNPSQSVNPAVLLVRTSAAGSPVSEAFIDSLGRTTRTAVQGFDGQYIYTDVTMDQLGRPLLSTEPYVGTPDAVTEFGDYDSLDRPGWRRIPNGRPSGLVSSYRYEGLKTFINVEGREMSRTYGTQKYLYETVDANGNSNRFAYDGAGNPLVIQDAKGKQIKASYNGFGVKTKVDDPNQGVSNFTYNAFGELLSSTDANGVITTLGYDALGRVTSKQISGGAAPGTHSFLYDTKKVGLLSQSSANGVTKSYTYNAALQPLTETTQIDGTSRTVTYQYDSVLGRLKGLQYPNGLTIANDYNAYGYLQKIKNAATGYTYRDITAMDAEGHVTDAQLAHGQIQSQTRYNSSGSMLYTQASSPVLGVFHNIGYTSYDSFMNPLAETNYATNETQSYSYDSMNRLTSYSLAKTGYNPVNVGYAYDATGNFLYKSDFSKAVSGAYQYGGDAACLASQNAGPNAVCRLTKVNGSVVTYNYDKRGNMLSGDGLTNVKYDSTDKPTLLDGRGATSSFVYDAAGERSKQIRTAASKTTTTYYVGKLFEADTDGAWRAYIGDVAIMAYSPETSTTLQFTLRDRLGSATTIADHNGMVVSRRFFDPFGKTGAVTQETPTKIVSFSNKFGDLQSTNRNRRGFTDHEHLDEQGLIHMNGRVYDQNLGRFMSVDPFIQSPKSTQSVNGYSYVMNNPMAGTDPTGYTVNPAECSVKRDCSLDQSGGDFTFGTRGKGGHLPPPMEVRFSTPDDGKTIKVKINGGTRAQQIAKARELKQLVQEGKLTVSNGGAKSDTGGQADQSPKLPVESNNNTSEENTNDGNERQNGGNETQPTETSMTVDDVIAQVQSEYPLAKIRITGRARTTNRQAELMADRLIASKDEFLSVYANRPHITEMINWQSANPNATRDEMVEAFNDIIVRAISNGAVVSNHLSNTARDISVPRGDTEQVNEIEDRFNELGVSIIREPNAPAGAHWHVDF